VKSGKMNSWPRDKGGKFFQELQGLKDNLGGSIVIGSFEFIDDLPSGVDRESLFAEGRPCNVSGYLFKLVSLPRVYGNTPVESQAGILANKSTFAEVVPVDLSFEHESFFSFIGTEQESVGTRGGLQMGKGFLHRDIELKRGVVIFYDDT
jgi:hypothetical protein